MKQEVIEKIAVERFPPIEEIIDIHDINDDINRTSQRKAFIEGALMVVEVESCSLESSNEFMPCSVTSCCKVGPITSEKYCPECGKQIPDKTE